MQSSNPNESSRARLLDNILSLYLLQGLNYLIPLAVLPYLVRTLGMEVYGLLAFSQSFAQYFNILTDYGFNYSGTRFIAQNQQDIDAISQTFCRIYLIKVILLCLGVVFLGVILLVIPRFRHESTYLLVAFSAVVGNVLFPTWYFQGIEKMRYISVLTGIPRVLSAVLLFAFVRGPKDGVVAIGIQSLGAVVAGALGLWFALRDVRLRLEWPSWGELRTSLEDGWHLFVSTAAISLYTNTNVFLVGMLAGNVQAGYFSAAEKMIRAMIGALGPITQAIFPHINSLVSRSRKAALAFIAKSLVWISTITLIPSLTILIVARPVTLLCFGPSAEPTVALVRWIALLPFLIGVSNVLGAQTMIPFGLDRQFSGILVGAGVLNVAIAVPLIHLFAAQGAAVAVLTTEALVTLTMLVVLRSHDIRIFGVRSLEA